MLATDRNKLSEGKAVERKTHSHAFPEPGIWPNSLPCGNHAAGRYSYLCQQGNEALPNNIMKLAMHISRICTFLPHSLFREERKQPKCYFNFNTWSQTR